VAPAELVSVERHWARAGVHFAHLEQFPLTEPVEIRPLWGATDFLARSDRIRRVLRQWHAQRGLTLIEFADAGAAGFRTIQAKRLGQDFTNVRLLVRQHRPSAAHRRANHRWTDYEDTRLDYAERYCVTHADAVLVRQAELRDRSDAQIAAVPPALVPTDVPRPNVPVREAVFVGRAERGHGWDTFAQLTPSVPADWDVTAFVPTAPAPDLLPLPARVQLHVGWPRLRILRYLAQRPCAVVLPRPLDASVQTLRECAALGVPVVGGTTVMELRTQLQHSAVPTVATDPRAVAAQYEQWRTPLPAARVAWTPRVTVIVPYYNLGEFLPATLAALAQQTYTNLEVIVIDDGSTEPLAQQVFANEQAKYPQFRFLRQPNAGVAATRNRALAAATGEYFLPVDADNLPRPEMVAAFVRAAEACPAVAVFTCYVWVFRSDAERLAGQWAYAGQPLGGPHVLGALENLYGDTNALFRTAALRAVGGYEASRSASIEDWEVYAKLHNAGYALDVVPAYLFDYRLRTDSALRSSCMYVNHQRVLQQFERLEQLAKTDQTTLWQTFVGLYQHLSATRWAQLHTHNELRATADRAQALHAEVQHLRARLNWRRYRWADLLGRLLAKLRRALRWGSLRS
jgi:GT2 family glycosyltransferase